MTGLLIGSIVLTVFGVLTHLGVIRTWLPTMNGFGKHLGFTVLYWGVCLGLFFGASVVDRDTTIHEVLVWGGIAFLFLGILSFLYYPRFLLPRWWIEEHED